MALVTVGFVTVWYGLRYLQARRDENGIYPTCSYRIPLTLHSESNPDLDSSGSSAGNPARPTMLHHNYHTSASHPKRREHATHHPSESNTTVASESSQVRADSAVTNASPGTKYGASADLNLGPGPGVEQTPQRTQEDGQVYNVDNSGEHSPKGRV
ncbi:hypothetical protein OG21DRAFT_1516097 [Imleria badia]|nr:hypothetical protein OG21DRAFT_1516097 [Imleria badia]